MSYYRMHRGWMDNPVFGKSAFSEREAWCWLIETAAWKPRQYRIGSGIIDLERGQLCASIRYIADAWAWKKDKTRRYLLTLQSARMIVIKSATAARQSEGVITICNYDIYQSECDSGATQSATATRQQRDSGATAARQRRDKTEEVEEVKEGKELYSVSNDTGASTPETDGDWLWTVGVAYLSTHGLTERHSRSLVGKWRKSGDKAARSAVQAAMDAGTNDPVPYVQKTLASCRHDVGSSAGNIDDMIAELERTYAGVSGLPRIKNV